VEVTTIVHSIRRLYTMDPKRDGLGLIEDAAIATHAGRVCWVGPSNQAPDADNRVDGSGLIGLPGLVDPHTHAVWAGSRSDEFAARLAGAKYADILEAGGGILSTVSATRSANTEDLRAHTRDRLRHMRSRGVTTVEVKSGYGLNPETELAMLKAAAPEGLGMRVVRTFLGAHTIPSEFRGRRDAYVQQIIEEQLPLCAPHADFIDVYCDRGAFELDEAVAILKAGSALGLSIRAHAEQVSHTGIAAAAAKLGATALDHLERIDAAGISAMAEAGTVAVLLPGAQLYLGDKAPPVAELREAGVPMAVGTDLNPGSSPVHDLWTAATLACLMQGLTMNEAILGITRHAAMALGLSDVGWIGPGSAADIALFAPPPGEPATVESLLQHMGRPGAEVLLVSGLTESE
jgi:imidazolonepropionase